ncbi:MAG TPA: MFS transporter [Bryobacteraceae bacterium]|nr:MFS transporter [Bryobacteraceae bacterium]
MTATGNKRRAALGFIVSLGIVSLFADMTYEGAHSAIGPYLQDLGASVFWIGLISGFGEMLAASLRYFSGKLADRTHAYWLITMLGYSMNVIAVPALALAGNWKVAAALVIAERTGKALRGPARDVLLSEATAQVGHGFGFGLHSIMDQTGAVIGPLVIAAGVMKTHHFGPAFGWLIVPAIGTLLALLSARLLYPAQGSSARTVTQQVLPKVFWTYIAAAGLLACGFIDFTVLAAHFERSQFFSKEVIPLLYAGAMAVNGITALIFGRLFDRFGVSVLVVGILISILSLPLGFLGGPGAAIASVACWATGLGAQDGSLRAGIAQVVSMNKRGSAFGYFNGVWGVLWFLGTAAMAALYGYSLMALVAFGVIAQLAAAVMFLQLRAPLAAARRE